MSLSLRLVLILGSALLLVYTFHKVKKAHVQITDTVFWIVVAVFLVLIAIFPQIVYFFSKLLQVQSPANLVFAFIIAILLVRSFLSSMRISQLSNRVNELSQEVALREKELRDQINRNQGK